MLELMQNLSWVAVFAGTVTAFVAGWIWYSPLLFGDQWADGLGVHMENRILVVPMLCQIGGLFLLSLFVGVSIEVPALLLLLLGAISFLLLGYSGESFAGHPIAVRLINAGYWMMALMVLVLVHALI
ncbi:MAG: DUF1761 domain-containing protein [Candidatus Puniceispirillaceae bacterium]